MESCVRGDGSDSHMFLTIRGGGLRRFTDTKNAVPDDVVGLRFTIPATDAPEVVTCLILAGPKSNVVHDDNNHR